MLTIYKASAGSGKTYQLTLHYIKNLLGRKVDDPHHQDGERWVLNEAYRDGLHPNVHRQILAITFTNKATEEMKARIISSLDGIAKGRHVQYIATLTELFGCTPGELGRAAASALSSLLLDYKFFNVSTIDSFFQSILRSFAYELDVQGDYEVELGEDSSVRDALNDILERVNYRRTRRGRHSDEDGTQIDKIGAWLKSLVRQRITDDKSSFNPFQRGQSLYGQLVDQVSQIFKEDFKSREGQMREYLIEREGSLDRFRAALTSRRPEIDGEVVANVRAIEAVLNRHGLTLENLNGNSFRKQLKGLLDTPPTWPAVSPTMERIIKGDESALKMVTKPPKSLGDSERDLETMRESLARIAELSRQRKLIDVVYDGLIYQELTGYMLKTMSAVNDERNRIVLGDTNRLIHQIISGSDTPFIYERIGVYLKNFLIDEFQDTSRMQWQNLLPLVKNALAGNDDSLIIGDTKQAIYRFRNSDSSMLGDTLTSRDFRNDPTVKEIGTNGSENTNYRTSETVVKFNNTIFPVFARLTGHPEGFRGGEVMQMSPESRLSEVCPGFVGLYPYGGDTDTTLSEMTERLVAEIEDAVNRGYRYSDIAILVRRHTDPKDIIDRLIEKDIPVQSRDSLYLSAARSVKMLVNLLQTFERLGTGEQSDGTQRITYDDTLYIMSRTEYLTSANPGLTWADALDQALEQFEGREEYGPTATLKEIGRSHPSSLSGLVESVIASGLIPDELLRTEKDYLAAFVDFVNEYSEERDDDLRGFLRHWHDRKSRLSLPPPPSSDAVAVMTVHQAKGLEWPIVHIPLFEWPATPPRTETKWVTTRRFRNGDEIEAPDVDISQALGLNIEPEDIPPLLKMQISSSLKGLNPDLDRLVDNIVALQAIDMLNLVYVGFTRPQRELHVYYKADSAGSHSGARLRETLEEIADRGEPEGELEMVFDENVYDRKSGVFTLGERTVSGNVTEPDDGVDESPLTVIDGYHSSYRPDTSIIVRVAAIDRDELEDPDEESEPEEADETDGGERQHEAARRGTGLHAILERVIERGDLAKAIEEGVFDNEDSRREAREVLEKAVADPRVADWFADSPSVTEVRTEMAVFEPNPLDAFDNGNVSRIDRLVFHTNGSIEIVDYKFTTGRKKDDRLQVDRYMRLIREIYPDRAVSGALWYVDRGEIKRLN